MYRFRMTAAAAALCAAVALTGCGGGGGNTGNHSGEGSTGNLIAAENEERDEERDDQGEDSEEEEVKPGNDLKVSGTDLYTQYFHLTVPQDWQEHVSYHYFQDPEAGRYALDLIESGVMTASEGTGGLAYSIVVYRGYGEEKEKGDTSRFLGMLEKEDGSYLYVFLEFPDGSGGAAEADEAFRSVLDYEDMIPAHLEGVSDYTFRPGDKPEEKETEE